MTPLTRFYRAIWVLDFEFHAPPGERPLPLCLVARELCRGRLVRCWLEGTVPPSLPWSTTPDTLLITFYGSAELGCCLALDWPFPTRLIDLFAEFRCLTSGRPVPCGYGLLGALTAYGLDGMAAAEKEDMRALAIRGGPYTPQEREALLAYCQEDVTALARLLEAMLPSLDLPRALLRGRYMCAAARMEWTGIPLDTTMLTQLQAHWDSIRRHLAHAVNRTCGVFVPEGQPALDPQTPYGAAVLRTAAARGLDPYHLAWDADHVWREQRELYANTLAAIKHARVQTGLTRAAIAH